MGQGGTVFQILNPMPFALCSLATGFWLLNFLSMVLTVR